MCTTSTSRSDMSACILSMSNSITRSISGLALAKVVLARLTFNVWAFCCKVMYLAT